MNPNLILNLHASASPRLRTSAAPALLAALTLQNEPMSTQELAQAIGYTDAATANILKALAAERFITSTQATRHGRPRGTPPTLHALAA
jgi:DNA-binding IclR family transcriptional regulator